MPRPTCQEDFYDYRVNRIFAALRKEHKESESEQTFAEWLEENSATVGDVFLQDVVTYMGIPEEDDE